MKLPRSIGAACLTGLLSANLSAQNSLKPASAPSAGDASPVRSAGMRLEWTHFIGGGGGDNLGWLRTPFLDREGMLYFTGTTKSANFPTTPDALDTHYHGGSERWGMEDVFLVKYSARQPGVVYATLLGGAKGPEHAADLFVDRDRNIYLVGNTGSSDFPNTPDALTKGFQGPDFRHADGFLTILSNDGRKIKYSTFVGGGKNDGVNQVFVDSDGEMTLFGITETPGFPSPDAWRPNGLQEGPTLYGLRLDARGQRILCSRLVANAWGTDLCRLDSGDFLMAGSTTNRQTATTEGVFNRTYNGGAAWGGGDLVITRLSADLCTVKFATLFGGAGDEYWPKIVAVPGGDFFVFGQTTSRNLPVTPDAIEKSMDSGKAVFLARFSGDGRRLKYCTYLGEKGTNAISWSRALVYDGGTRLYVTGSTTSPYFPVTPDALQPKLAGGQDGFLAAFNLADNTLAYSSYLGGSKDDRDLRLAAAGDDALYVIGATDSDDFPSLETTPMPRKDRAVFVSKFSLRPEPGRRQP